MLYSGRRRARDGRPCSKGPLSIASSRTYGTLPFKSFRSGRQARSPSGHSLRIKPAFYVFFIESLSLIDGLASEDGHVRRSHTTASVTWPLAIGTAGIIVTIGIMIWMPAYVSFAVSVAGAVCWCIWLERHPIE
jgi:hypothetical protein